MDKRSTIGMLIIMILLYGFIFLNKPSEEEMQALPSKDKVDEQKIESKDSEVDITEANNAQQLVNESGSDSLALEMLKSQLGPFAPAALASEERTTIENDLMAVTFSNKGGRIVDIHLKNYKKVVETENKKEELKEPLHLMNNAADKWSFHLPVHGLPNGLNTENLFFRPELRGNTISFVASTANGGSFKQTYILSDGYDIDYKVEIDGLNQTLASDDIRLLWVSNLDKLEKNADYERRMSTVYYKENKKNTDHCNCSKDDEDKIGKEKGIKWISHSNQFFNTSLIADESFGSGTMRTIAPAEESSILKTLETDVILPIGVDKENTMDMTIYVGPNEFDLLYAHGNGLQNIIPFGSSVFGTINQWVIRPMFNFLNGIFTSKGVSIIILTLLVKMLVYPLTYRSLKSAAKMQALKPELEKLKEKNKDDSQKTQMESMKLYQEYGVNPAGGCFPMLLQMPIWFAIFRFFPASIQFRQEPFLWATDLSSYDVFFQLPSSIPFLGGHISLFALLWAISSVIYSVYNMKAMNPAQMSDQMKPMMYMQYFMPIMFFVVFNNYASGLSCYFFFSNMINIIQTLVTKNYIIDNKKIRAQLEENKKKPKKQGGFQDRLQKALAEQQKVAQDRQMKAESAKKKKKR